MASFSRAASQVFICKSNNYDDDVETKLYEALRVLAPRVKEKTVLLKPNFVGLDSMGAVNTHPAVVRAAREVFLRLGAQRVQIGEATALERDTEAIVESMGLRDYVGSLRDTFVDLNTGDVRCVPLRTQASRLKELYLPEAVLRADFVVSMPKLKTHHWAGVTLSLKNMFGIVPGCCYGWPKNILHWAGITRSLLDINSTLCADFSIVDGILGMEGNGPLQGEPRQCGVLVCGEDPVSVDATCSRIMGFVPERIEHVRRASYLLGNLDEKKIQQVGESLAAVSAPFRPPPSFERIASARHGR